MRIIILLSFLFSAPVFANSWLDKVKAEYDKAVDKISTKSAKDIAPTLPLPTEHPESWHYQYFQEPVFGSQMAVMQTGMEHSESIVLVHGLGTLAMQDWYLVVPFLANKYHVIAVDLPGFGYSQKPEGKYSPTKYAQVLAAVVSKFAKNKVTIMGHSMGGAVSIRFAANYPQMLSNLVLVDVAGILQKTAFVKHFGELKLDTEYMPGLVKNMIAQVNDVSSTFIEKTSTNEISEAIEKNNLTQNLLARSNNINAALSLVEENFSDALGKITADTLIIWGEEDQVTPLRTGKVLEHKIQGAKLVTIPGAQHTPMKSHNTEFIKLLGKTYDDQLAQPSYVRSQVSQGDLICENKNNLVFSGNYNKVRINSCSNITLSNLSAKQLIISDSLVNAENLFINSKETAISASESVIKVTNGKINTKEAIRLLGSRLDLAGVEIIAPNQSILAEEASDLVFSLSHISEKTYYGHVHGTYRLDNQAITQFLGK